jgi:hypothetical protein
MSLGGWMRLVGDTSGIVVASLWDRWVLAVVPVTHYVDG